MKNELTLLIEKFLRRQISDKEVLQLKELLTQAGAEDMLSDLYDEKWEQVTSNPEKEVEDRIWLELREKIQPKPSMPVKRIIWKKSLRIAASILVPLFCLGLGYFYSENKLKQNNDKMTVQVEIGQKVKMQLADGTNVWLNSASSLAYDNTYNKIDRIIYLQGEAYFEVSKDKVRPFIVKTNDISVKALGTSFNVKAYPDDNYIATTLIEGSVQVKTPFQSEILAPNEKLIFYKDNDMISKSILQNTEKNTSWTNSQLAFEQERLEDMAKTLERMYNIRIHFASDKLKNIRFSGNLKNNNLENVLQLISFVSPIQYSMENDTTVIIRSK